MDIREDLNFAVIGLGAFGSTLARKLAEEGASVIAVDYNMDHLDEVKDIVHDTICFDATDPEMLEEHGITEVDVAVVAIGEDFKPVVLISMELLSAGVEEVYARAGSLTEEKILNKIGITDVVHPERQVADRMGISLLRKGMRDIFEVGGGLAVFEIEAPPALIGHTLNELELRSKFEVNLITIKRAVVLDEELESEEEEEEEQPEFEPIGIVTGQTEIREKDQLVVVGKKSKIDKLLELSR